MPWPVLSVLLMRSFLLLVILLSSQLFAAVYAPYPEARITVEQWQAYFDTVLLELADTKQDIAELNLVLFHDAATATYYAFTTARNPAHPAWVTRRFVEQDGAIAVEQIGYFAGDEGPFADLFDAYADITDELRAEFEGE